MSAEFIAHEGTDLETIEEEPPATEAKLQEITTQANLQYSLKHYSEAAELYSEACQLQDELHGEMAPQNAELFYMYGRALYKVAVQNSDVLGGQVAAGKKKQKANGAGKSAASAQEKLGAEILEAAVESKGSGDGAGKDAQQKGAGQPYFQITGMENWDSDEDEEGEGEEGAGAAAEEEEEDDFATAYEILDMARVLYQKQVEGLDGTAQDAEGKGKGKSEGLSAAEKQVKERLAEVHDLQAEISLENERFEDAIPDSRAALDLKLKLYPQESSMVAEAHYKLSLALEFASVTKLREAQAAEGENAKVTKDAVDEQMRSEAAEQMELAIASCEARIRTEEQASQSLEGEAKTKQEQSVTEVKEIVEDMKTRLADLKGPAVSLSAGPAGVADPALAASGILAQALGETQEEQRKRIEAATKNANDLSGLVKRKKPKTEANGVEAVAAAMNGGGKRKLENGDRDGSEDKKVRISEA